MKTQTLTLGLALALNPLAATTAVSSRPPSTFWLEQRPRPNWNTPAASIPTATNLTPPNTVHCKQQIPNPSTPEERAVKAAGWVVFKVRGETQSAGGVVLVRGQTNYDGMCRPMGYQQFVFVNGVFAGTIAPNVMHSRFDGALIQTNIETPSRLKALFSRYTPQDGLSSPSRTSEVTYRIDVINNQPLVVPMTVITYDNPV